MPVITDYHVPGLERDKEAFMKIIVVSVMVLRVSLNIGLKNILALPALMTAGEIPMPFIMSIP